jgi:hypothetical protein
MSAEELRAVCIEAGADDVGFVETGRKAISSEMPDILRIFSKARTIISIAKKTNPESIRSRSVSVANYEFAMVHLEMAESTKRILKKLIQWDTGVQPYHQVFPWIWIAGRERYGT